MLSFNAEWILFIPALYIGIFILIVIAKTIFKDKIKNIEQASTAGAGLIPAIISFCIVCAIPVLGFFGFLFDFPPLIVALMLGSSAHITADFIIKYLEKKNKAFTMHIFVINAVFMTLAVLLLYSIYHTDQIPAETLNPDIHIHADLKIYKDDEEINLYKPENIERDKYVHFHHGDNQTNVIHVEGKGNVVLVDFLRTIKFNFASDCLSGVIQGGEAIYTYYVNGIPSGQPPDVYEIKDLDKLLLVCHGTATKEMIESVGSNSCIQSKKC